MTKHVALKRMKGIGGVIEKDTQFTIEAYGTDSIVCKIVGTNKHIRVALTDENEYLYAYEEVKE